MTSVGRGWLTVYCVLSGLTATIGRKLRNLKGSESVQILPVSQIQPTAHPRPTLPTLLPLSPKWAIKSPAGAIH